MNPNHRRIILGISFLSGTGLLAIFGFTSGAESPWGMAVSVGCLAFGLLLTGFAIQTTVWWGKYGLLDEPHETQRSDRNGC